MKLVIKTLEELIEIEGEKGARLDDLILSAGVLLDRPCAGKGTCGKCVVKVSGEVSPPAEAELDRLSPADLSEGYRLACRVELTGDCEVIIEEGAVFTDKSFAPKEDLGAISEELGLAVDLGTTTVAAFITGLESEKVYAGNAVLNKQTVHGAEVMSRLMHAHENKDDIGLLAWQSIREAVEGLGLRKEVAARIKKCVVVCNSAMHHIALGLPVEDLMEEPFEPHTNALMEAAPEKIELAVPGIESIKFAPLIGGFVGSDALACLVYFNLGREDENAVAVDLGTNGEVILATGGRFFAASTAAGPAFEGVNISCGMRAIPGAATSVWWEEDKGFSFKVIGDAEPCGLTGSGLLSAVRTLRELGVIEASGRMADPGEVEGVEIITDEEGKRVKLATDLYLSQIDIRELQKAKSAVRAAVEVLINRAGLMPADLRRVVLTGSFGGKLARDDVLELGVIPPVNKNRIHSIPNGAGFGAAMFLDDRKLADSVELADRVEHVELNFDPSFMDLYVEGMILSGEPIKI